MGRTLATIAAIICLNTYCICQTPNPPGVTFTKDVAPILQKHCQTCHRPGEAAPFPLLTYEQARPWAASMKRVVKQKMMPPWFADPSYGHFANDRSLTEKEISTILAWVNAGAPQGDPADMPAPPLSATSRHIQCSKEHLIQSPRRRVVAEKMAPQAQAFSPF